jgi:hypothetical protein
MPVQFICPNCRRTLSVTRRKVGHQVTCPKCAAPITVPATQPALAGAAILSVARPELEQVDMSDFVDFEDLSDLTVDQPRLRPVRIPTEAPTSSPGVLVSRTSIYLQAVLLLLVATVAFGLGYWLGGVDAKRGSQSAPSSQ